MINQKSKEVAVKLWVELIVFWSAYYPLFLILFIRDLGRSLNGVPMGQAEWQVTASAWGIFLLLGSSISCLFVGSIMRNLLIHQHGGTSIRLAEAEPVRGDMLNYTLPFLIGLFAFSYDDWQSITSLLVFLGFMFSFLHKERASLLNPMFLLMNIRLYKIVYSEVGRSSSFSGNALCFGEASASDHIVEIKETAGIKFIYPHAQRKETEL